MDHERVHPKGDIPSLGGLTVYMGESKNLSRELLQEFIDDIEKGSIKLNIDKVFPLKELVNAHQYMEDNKAKEKIMVEIGATALSKKYYLNPACTYYQTIVLPHY